MSHMNISLSNTNSTSFPTPLVKQAMPNNELTYSDAPVHKQSSSGKINRKPHVKVRGDYSATSSSHTKRCATLCGSINRRRLLENFAFGVLCKSCARKKPLVLALPVSSVDNLLDLENPFGFGQVNADVVEFLLQKAWDELLYRQTAEIIIYTNTPEDVDRKDEVALAMSKSFKFAAKMTNYELKRTLSEGIIAVWIAVIATGLVLAIYIPIILEFGQNEWTELATSILVIFIWVAIWHPTELLLFGRYMLRQKRNVLKTLGEAVIEIHPTHDISSTKGREVMSRSNSVFFIEDLENDDEYVTMDKLV